MLAGEQGEIAQALVCRKSGAFEAGWDWVRATVVQDGVMCAEKRRWTAEHAGKDSGI
jgi:hypothetical protein